MTYEPIPAAKWELLADTGVRKVYTTASEGVSVFFTLDAAGFGFYELDVTRTSSHAGASIGKVTFIRDRSKGLYETSQVNSAQGMIPYAALVGDREGLPANDVRVFTELFAGLLKQRTR